MNPLVLLAIFIRTWHWPSRLIEVNPEVGEYRECAICHERMWYAEA
jgi:hypothetical protein